MRPAEAPAALLDALRSPAADVFDVVGHALDSLPVSRCAQLWGEIEKHSDALYKCVTENQFNTVLRVTNALLRRLSQTQDSHLRGRVCLLVANLLVVSHRSGVNVLGAINDQFPVEVEAKDVFSGAPGEYDDYVAFWNVHAHFASKPIRPWLEFKEAADAVLRLLSQHRRFNLLVAPIPATGPHLTSGKLFALQLNDPELHRQVLVQILIHLTRYPEGNEARLAMEERVFELLKGTPPDGPAFTDAMRIAKERESVWIAWKSKREDKKTTCDAFERQADAHDPGVRFVPSLGPKAKREPVWDPADLESPVASDQLPAHLTQVMERMVEALDPDAGIEDEYHPRKDVGYCLKGLRVAAREGICHFKSIRGPDFEHFCLAALGRPVPKEIIPEPIDVVVPDATAAVATPATEAVVPAVEVNETRPASSTPSAAEDPPTATSPSGTVEETPQSAEQEQESKLAPAKSTSPEEYSGLAIEINTTSLGPEEITIATEADYHISGLAFEVDSGAPAEVDSENAGEAEEEAAPRKRQRVEPDENAE